MHAEFALFGVGVNFFNIYRENVRLGEHEVGGHFLYTNIHQCRAPCKM